MLHLEIVTFITKKGFEHGFSNWWICKFEVYPLGEAFKDEPLVSIERELEEERFGLMDIGFADEMYPKMLLEAVFNIVYEEGKANPGAIGKVRVYKGTSWCDWDLIYVWLRGQPLVKNVSL